MALEVIDWLNENELRSYPLVPSAQNVSPPDAVILDLLLVSTASLGSLPVLLLSVTKAGTVLTFTFGTTSQTVATFPVDTTAATYPYYSRLPGGSLLVLGSSTQAFLASLSSGVTTYETPVEPTLCHELGGAWLGVAGISATPAKETAGTGPLPTLPLVPTSSTTLTGDVTLLEGFNFRVSLANGTLDLEIGDSLGLRQDCASFLLDSVYHDCDDIVSYLNGVAPDAAGNINLTAGTSISIVQGTQLTTFDDRFSEEAAPHTIFVGLDFQTSDLCAAITLKPSDL